MERLNEQASRVRRAVRVSVAVAALTCGVALAGCASVRSDLGTANSNCYVAIPDASGAVHHQGHLDGVRLVGVPSLKRWGGGLLWQAASSERPTVTRVCLIAFAGRFRAEEVADPVGASTGSLAVVAVSYPGNRLIATLLLSQAPFPFGHTHVAAP